MKNRSNFSSALFFLPIVLSFAHMKPMGRENSTSSLGSMGDWEDVAHLEMQAPQQSSHTTQEQQNTAVTYSSPIIFSNYQQTLSTTAKKAVALTDSLAPENNILNHNTASSQSSSNVLPSESHASTSSCNCSSSTSPEISDSEPSSISSISSSESASTTTPTQPPSTMATLIAASASAASTATSSSSASPEITVIADNTESPKDLHRRLTPPISTEKKSNKSLHDQDFKTMKEAEPYKYVVSPITPKKTTRQATPVQSMNTEAPKEDKKKEEKPKSTLWQKIKQCCSCCQKK